MCAIFVVMLTAARLPHFVFRYVADVELFVNVQSTFFVSEIGNALFVGILEAFFNVCACNISQYYKCLKRFYDESLTGDK